MMTKSRTLVSLFEEGFSRNSNALAVKFDGATAVDDVQQLTYAQVNENAEIICLKLRQIGVDHQMVACSGETHVNAPSVMLGIMRVPAAFFFVNFWMHHQDNVKFLIDLGIRYLLVDVTSSPDIDRMFKVASTVITIRGLHGSSQGMRLYELPVETKLVGRYENFASSGWDLAYAVTTSGSTGPPKFVKVPHRSIVPNVDHFRNMFNVSCNDIVFVASPLTFDPCIVDIFLAFCSGASIVLVPDRVKRTPRILASVLTDRNRISIIQATPSIIRRFGVDLLKTSVLGPGSSLRVLGLGGEPCPSVADLSAWTELSRRDTHGKVLLDIYNVYGTTEVSSWASLYRLDLNANNENATDVPIGEPIPGTEMIVRDENGARITSGVGQMFIGGSERICFVGSEDLSLVVSNLPVLRPTGDRVKIDEKGIIFHLYRLDGRIIRNGKLFSLKHLEIVSSSFPNVCVAKAVWDSWPERLILAVVLDNYAEIASCGMELVVVQKLRRHVTSLTANVPDSIVLMDSLPVTVNGKFDKHKVVELAETRQISYDENDVSGELRTIWNSARNVDEAESVNDTDNFLFCGGDSVGAVVFCEEVRCRLRLQDLTQLMDKLLHETFAQVCQYLSKQIKEPSNQGESSVRNGLQKFAVIKKANYSGNLKTTNSISRGSSMSHLKDPKGRPLSEISFNLSWRYDTGKCVDASPLLVIDNLKRWTVYIGSHSRAFVAVDLTSGLEKWRFLADDRIESSACVSSCSKYVFVGSYDRHLYCLLAESGELCWKFETGDAVKSSPVAHPHNGNVFFGSHDCSVYALEIKTGLVSWSCKIGKGSVFSSPCLMLEPFHHLYAGSLDGILCALCPDTGLKLWSQDLSQPLFSSPTLTSVGVCVGCVDYNLYCFSHTGSKLWQFACEAPLFSSPCFHDDTDLVIVGCHDRRVYCLRAKDGRLQWKSGQLESEIYSTPFVHNAHAAIFVCTTKRNLHALNLPDGASLGEFSFPGDVFSSPIAVADKLVVGCRDNHLYCLGLEPKIKRNKRKVNNFRTLKQFSS